MLVYRERETDRAREWKRSVGGRVRRRMGVGGEREEFIDNQQMTESR